MCLVGVKVIEIESVGTLSMTDLAFIWVKIGKESRIPCPFFRKG